MGNSLVFSCLYPIFPAYSFCRPYRFIPLSIYYRGLECLVEINDEMRCRKWFDDENYSTKAFSWTSFAAFPISPLQQFLQHIRCLKVIQWFRSKAFTGRHK